MTLTITIDNATEATRVLNGVCEATAWKSDSGITKADWVRQQIGSYLKLMAKRGEMKVSQATIISGIDAIVIH